MATVDPYTQPLPKTIQDKNGNITAEFRQWLVFDNIWKFQMWQRSGGGTDSTDQLLQTINALENQVDFLFGYARGLRYTIQDLESESSVNKVNIPKWYNVNINAAHTAIDNEELNVTQGAPITMPTSGRVKVNNIDGSTVPVYMSGSQTIFGESIVLIESKGSVVFKYLPESDQWVFE